MPSKQFGAQRDTDWPFSSMRWSSHSISRCSFPSCRSVGRKRKRRDPANFRRNRAVENRTRAGGLLKVLEVVNGLL